MGKIHLLCNAHLDPVWLWRWEEGYTEAISTFQTAVDLLDKFEGFIFNHNESILYEWVKESDPVLFEKIKEKVREGKWNIMGGWYLQPDCNMPSGESMIRNIMMGKKFFKEEFDKSPTTAINFDSFGHSKGLVQILNQTGYDSYVAARTGPETTGFAHKDFIWRGLNDSEVLVHRADEFYNSVLGEVEKKLNLFMEADSTAKDADLFLWGVGDHGGGPSRIDLTVLAKKIKEEKHQELVHSGAEEYFKELRCLKKELPVYEKGLNPLCEGCYTSQVRVKQKHRLLENELYSGEKMLTVAEALYKRPYPVEKIKETVKSLIFSEFHDALPGSGTQLVEEDTLRELDYGLVMLSREKIKAFLALCTGQEKVIDGTSCAFIYNPHPYPVTGQFEFEISLPKQNWENNFQYPRAECNGAEVPTQAEMESSHFCIDWRKKVVVEATLLPSQMNRMDVYFEALPKRPIYEVITKNNKIYFDNGEMQVAINTANGLIDSYTVDGILYLNPESMQLAAYDDTCNPWGINTEESQCRRNFTLLTPHDGSAFSGLKNKVIPSVRVIEDGAVRTVVEAVFGWHDSWAYQRYILPKKGTAFEVETGVYWNEKDRYLKLEVNTALKNADYYGQIMFGQEMLSGDGREMTAQKWVMCREEDKAFSIINNGTYGSSMKAGRVGLTLLRSPGYSAADGNYEKTLEEERHTVRMDQGEHKYKFRFQGGSCIELNHTIDQEAQLYNEHPYAMPFNSPLKGEKRKPFIQLDNRAVILSALKKSEDERGYIIRLYESEGIAQCVRMKLALLEEEAKIDFKPYEVKTVYFCPDSLTLKEIDMSEGC